MMTNSRGFPQLRRLFGSLQRHDSVTIGERATPPTIEAGTSIMNQHVNRRDILSSSAIATAAIAVAGQEARAGDASAPGVSLELKGLIEAKHAAYARFNTAIDVANDLEEAYLPKTAELYVPLTIGGGQSRSLRYSELESVEADLSDDIKRRYAEQQQKLAALAKVAPDLGKQSTVALRKAEQADLRTLKRLIKEERARRSAVGLEQAINERNEASDAERYALNAVCSYRCTSMEEHRVRAEFLMEFATGKYGDLQTEDIDALLWSFLPVEALDAAVEAVERKAG